jgi:hypothetical protein
MTQAAKGARQNYDMAAQHKFNQITVGGGHNNAFK